MEEPKKFTGQWWLPAAVERRIPGTFELRDRFMELSLEAPLVTHGVNVQDEIPIVHGISRGESLTLITCRTFEFLQPFVAFQVRDAVVGAHIGATHLSFAEASVAIEGLTDWMPARGLKASTHTLRAKPGEVAIEVSYTAQRPLRGILADGTHVQLDSFPQPSWGIQRFSIATGASLRFRPRRRATAADLASTYVAPLQELVSWATQQPSLVTAAYLKSSIKGEAFTWLRAWRQNPVQEDKPALGNIRFYAYDLKPNFGAGLRQWMAVRNQSSEPLALLVSLLFATPRYMDTALLLTAQALEAYHRVKFPNKRWPTAEFKARKRAVLERFDSAEDQPLQEWMSDLLRFANEPPLIDRLHALHDKAEPVLADLFKRRPQWAEQLKDMRHKFTHRGKRPPRYSGNELFQMARFGRLVLDVCLILDLGISVDVCRKRVQQWSDFSWAMSEALDASKS